MHCKGQFGGRNPWAVACLKDKNMNNFIFLVNAEALWVPRGSVACLKDKNRNSFIFLVNAEAVWAPLGTVVSEAISMDNFYILQMATGPI
ncbi:hypothetical protein TUM3811_28320 [Shewanella algae]|nr:hypothetical protein TUM3811_28320 [Shewanella algae]